MADYWVNEFWYHLEVIFKLGLLYAVYCFFEKILDKKSKL